MPANPMRGPSAWPKRVPVIALALFGCGIATYLALYQVGMIEHVWEPFFGSGSRTILRESSVAHLLPIPDAALGAILYLAEAVFESMGGTTRWRTAPWVVLVAGLLATGLGIGGVVLAICQPLLYGAFCTLCLTSAACSVLVFAAAIHEPLATVGHLRTALRHGCPFWRTLWGTQVSALR